MLSTFQKNEGGFYALNLMAGRTVDGTGKGVRVGNEIQEIGNGWDLNP